MKKYILSTILALSLFGFLGFCIITNQNGEYRKYFPNRLPFVYQLHVSTPEQFISTIEASANQWNNIEGCYFVFQRGANTNVSVVANDGVNIVYLDMQGVNFSDPNVIAFSSTFTTTVGGYQAVGSDLIWNGRDFPPSTTGEPNKMDLLSVMTHEFGHHMGLNHAGQPPSPSAGSNGCGPLNPNAVMWYAIARGDTTKRYLTLDDIMGAIAIYPVWVVRGNILDGSTNAPLVGAKVRFEGTYGSIIGNVEQPFTNRWSVPGVPLKQIIIDSTGQYMTAVKDQSFKMIVEKFGYYSDSAMVNFDPPSGIGQTQNLIFNFALAPKTNSLLSGFIVDGKTNEGIQGRIDVFSINYNEFVGSFTSQSNGYYQLSLPQEELYKLVIYFDPPYPRRIILDSVFVGTTNKNLNISVNKAGLFFVVNDTSATTKSKYINSLERLGIPFAYWDIVSRNSSPTQSLFDRFDPALITFWVAGGPTSSNLSNDERTLMINQFEAGNRVILAGNNIAQYSDTADVLLAQYFGVRFVTNTNANGLKGFTNDYIGHGLNFNLLATGKDYVRLTTNALGTKYARSFHHGTGTADTIRTPPVRGEHSVNKWKSVFYAIGLDLLTEANLDTLLNRTIKFCADTNFVTKVEDVYSVSTLPVRYYLHQNYPNPFNPNTIIKFDLPARSQVEVSIYDVNGKLVKKLINDQKEAGYHSVEWNGTDAYGRKVSSGIYFYRISAKNLRNGSEFIQTKKMVLLK
jgi:hypothetical protein